MLCYPGSAFDNVFNVGGILRGGTFGNKATIQITAPALGWNADKARSSLLPINCFKGTWNCPIISCQNNPQNPPKIPKKMVADF